MDDLKFYFSVFLRRLPWFLVISTLITAIAVIVAISLPPAYVSQSQLVVQQPQIDPSGGPVDQTPALEHLQIIEQQLMTRANLLNIARRLDVLENVDELSPDQIVRAMRARTVLATRSGRGQATSMTVSFEASTARIAAAVVNEYVTIMQEADAEIRGVRSSDRVEFFAQQVARLEAELNEISARIVNFQQENVGALPETMELRMSRRDEVREAIIIADRDITRLKGQRERILQLFEATGRVAIDGNRTVITPEQEQLRALQNELDEALLVFAETHPRVRSLRQRIESLEAKVAATVPVTGDGGTSLNVRETTAIEVQIAEIDEEIDLLEEQRARLQSDLATLDETLERTAEVTITLEELDRDYARVGGQLDQAEAEMARAETQEIINSNARGQRLDVIEQPIVPSEPTKPNRVLIAGGGGFLGILAGLGLIVLLEMMNSAVRRPEDLVARFGISPFTTIPYIRTRRQTIVQRGLKLATIMIILLGIPAAIYAMHIYYLPVDIVADRVMDRLGMRW
ncbi:MAG: lipopolysaccharide biosynthesis protein [Pseudomonadota bacterium]